MTFGYSLECMDFEAAMARIHTITGTRTQVELAKVLGIRQSSISDAKRRQSIPDSWLQTIIWKFDGNPRWVLGESERPYICEDTSRDLANPAPMARHRRRGQGPQPERLGGRVHGHAGAGRQPQLARGLFQRGRRHHDP